MRRAFAIGIAAALLLFGKAASAHRIDEYLQATVLSLDLHRVQASMRLIPGISIAPSVIAGIDSNGDGAFSQEEERSYAQHVLAALSLTIDGRRVQPTLISWSFPQPAELRDGLGEIRIAYGADLPRGGAERTLVLANQPLSSSSVYLVNLLVPEDHALRILAQKRNQQQSLYELDYQQSGATESHAPWNDLRVLRDGLQSSSLFHLGMRHIAEGTDHLLFLLTLLLPAPLLVSGSRWGHADGVRPSLLRILGIVTAFTIGHSLTLTLAALGAAHVPGRPVEVLIAVSIFVSAVHALRPIVPGKEALLAGCFGLVHGLAFASTLDRLGLGLGERLAGILAFNLGIETMQMLVVAAVLPSLLLISRTPLYPFCRIGGAIFAGVAALGWMVERLFHTRPPVDLVVNALARQSIWIAIALFLLSLACRLLLGLPSRRIARADRIPELSTSLHGRSGS